MIQKVLKHWDELQRYLEELPPEQKAILSSKTNHFSSSLQELSSQFMSLLLTTEDRYHLEKINHKLELKLSQQNSKIGNLEQQLERSQLLYKRVTKALTQGESRFKTILKNSSELITIIEADGQIRDQNSVALERILGYKPDQRIGVFHSDLLHPDDVPAWEAYFARLLKRPGIAPQIEYRKRHANGDWVYLEVIANNLLHDSSINGIILNSRDITERKLSAAALEKSQKQMFNILENITYGFLAIDRHWQFTYVNAKAEDCLHKKRQELLGKNIWEQFPDSAKTIFFDNCHKAVSRKVAVKFEEYYEPLNTWFEIEAYPSEEGLSVFFQDITDRKNAENALKKIYSQLQQQTKLLDTVLSTTPDRLLMLDRSGRLTYINRAGLELTPLSKTCILGKTLEKICWPPELIKLHNKCWKNLLATGQSLTTETDFIHPQTGRRNYCSYIFSPIRSAEGCIVAVLVTNRDITELKKAEAALRASESRYRILSQITSDFAYSFNLLPDQTWACEWMTEAFTRVTGYSASEIAHSGLPECNWIHPEDREMLREQMQSRSRSCKEVSEYRIVTKSGEVRWLWDCRQVVWDEAENRPVGVFGACQDITEHKLVEAKLCETNQVLEGLIKALPVAVVGVDANTLVTAWNPAAEQIFRWQQCEVLGQSLPIVPSDEVTDFSVMFKSELAGELQFAKDCRRQRKDGSLIDVRVSSLPLRSPQGLITGTMKIFSEISAPNGKPHQTRNIKGNCDESQPFWASYVRIPHLKKL
ncbi:PAS domain S-box protein [Microcoleus sp. LEGE 07076]|uniref:PAS domain-containing protein n=1 Tax=Microcoleus sp. LEGE 07076 TaxID=915322 RepID=UPI001881C9C0|nr:PAS domain S-box protein [Microcoleus sp. LEGE 07076]MBE9185045.1 PAS domain S-box protein [Microcoleus sp. LEGE 07076]